MQLPLNFSCMITENDWLGTFMQINSDLAPRHHLLLH